MTKEEFKNITHTLINNVTVTPIYEGYEFDEFKILAVDKKEGLIEINQPLYNKETKWYRYENLKINE